MTQQFTMVMGLLPCVLLASCTRSSPSSEVADSSEIPTVEASLDRPTIGHVERLAKELDSLIPADAKIEVLAQGFDWAEGPLWIADGDYVLFSDVPTNRIYRWREGEGHTVWLDPSADEVVDSSG